MRPSSPPIRRSPKNRVRDWCSHVSQTNVKWLTHEDFRVSEPQHLCCDQPTMDNEAPRLLSGKENEYNEYAVSTFRIDPGVFTFPLTVNTAFFALQSRNIMGSAQLSLIQPKCIQRELSGLRWVLPIPLPRHRMCWISVFR